jgi:hypothetical protein
MKNKTFFKMGRWWLVVSFGLLLILASAYTIAGNQADLFLTVEVPIHNGQRTIQVGRQASLFHVVIENSSEHQINLWREWCSWGYFNLKFQITDEKGATWIVRKKEKEWDKNFPDFVSINPSDKMVIDVTLNSDIWENILPHDIELSTTVSMIAIYDGENSEDARKRGIWSGKLVSEKREYILLQQND